ncbi:MAG: hypothetical protein H6636_06480 [Anaerolineales bacterium]|nr:hypothetical protein [Anaerolineales bacterium]
MQEITILYPANKTDWNVRWTRLLARLDVAAFFALILGMAFFFWVGLTSNNPTTHQWMRWLVGGIAVSTGILVLMVLINAFGQWGWLVLIPLGLIGLVWLFGAEILRFWADGMGQSVVEGAKFAGYAFGGMVGLGLLARLIEKVGTWGLVGTLTLAVSVAYWFIH